MLVIKGAKIFTSAGAVYDQGEILVEGDKIKQVGPKVDAPSGCDVLDATGLVAMPGIVDPHCHITAFNTGNSGQDLNEMTACATPEVEALYSVDTSSPQLKRVAKSGITTSLITPGSGNVICGVACVIKSAGSGIEDMCIKNPAALKMALGGNPKGVYGPRKQRPMTRMGIAQVIRDNLIKGQEYLRKQQEAGGDPEKMPEYDAGLEHIGMALRREIPIKVHCEQFDMLTTIRIAKEFNLDFTIDHAWGASDYYDEIASSGVRGIIFGPIGVNLSPGECGKVDIDSVIELTRRGVCCSIMTDGPIMNPDLLVAQAGEVVRFGGELAGALDMLTINAAKIIGLDHRIGSLEPGKDADIVLFNGQPAVDTAASVAYTMVNGDMVYKAE